MALQEVGFPVIFNVIYMKVVFFSLLSMLNPISCFPRPILEGLGALKCLLLPEFGCCEQKKNPQALYQISLSETTSGCFTPGIPQHALVNAWVVIMHLQGLKMHKWHTIHPQWVPVQRVFTPLFKATYLQLKPATTCQRVIDLQVTDCSTLAQQGKTIWSYLLTPLVISLLAFDTESHSKELVSDNFS